jgi:hypothetical protein
MGNICTGGTEEALNIDNNKDLSNGSAPEKRAISAQAGRNNAPPHGHEDRIVRQTKAKARMNVFTKPLSQSEYLAVRVACGRFLD